jgi:hypothetical protein
VRNIFARSHIEHSGDVIRARYKIPLVTWKQCQMFLGCRASWNVLDYWSGFNDTTKGKKIKSTMCVFGKII